MHKSQIFFWGAFSFILGAGAVSWWHPHQIETYHIFIPGILVLIIAFSFHSNRQVIFFGLLIFCFLSGAYWVNRKLEKINNLEDGQFLSGRARVVREPRKKEFGQEIVLEAINMPGEKGRFLLNANLYEKYSYGDVLKIECGLERPKNFKDSDFDYSMYLAKDEIFYLCKKSKIEKLSSGDGNKVYAALIDIKNQVGRKIEKMVSSPESGLLFGLLLGGDDKLSKTVKEDFSRTGMSHIVAVSGYNVMIIAEYLIMSGISIGLWRRQAFWLAVGGIIIFVTMIGLPSSAVRAGVMGMLLLWAAKNGRLANSGNAILFSAGIMLFFNPLILRWDIGFQLSFLATLGIVYFYPIFKKHFIDPLTETRQCLVSTAVGKLILETFFLTMSAQVLVLPVILYDFQKLSIISPLANILVLPIIPLSMLLGFLTALFSFIFPPLALVFSWITYLPLRYETCVISFLSDLKFSSVEISLSWWGVGIWYIIVISFIYFQKKNEKKINL